VIWRAQIVALCLTTPLGFRDLLHAHWSTGPVLSLLALGALGTGAAFILATTLAGRVGATRASAMGFLIPPVALALGVLVRGEQVAPLAVLGAAICVAGAELMRRAQHPGPAPRAAVSPAAAPLASGAR
jgi:drug/metabolite transporter (DMT)-like permease